MATQLPESKHPGNGEGRKVPAAGELGRLEHLSRIVDRDIEVLRANLVQCRQGRAGDESWARLESAWQTVRSELADAKTSPSRQQDETPSGPTTLAGSQIVVPAMSPAAARMQEPRSWFAEVLMPALSSRTRQIVSWIRAPERRTQLRAAMSRIGDFAGRTASAWAKYLNHGRIRLQELIRTTTTQLKDQHAQRVRSRQARKQKRAFEESSSPAPTEVYQFEPIAHVAEFSFDAVEAPAPEVTPATLEQIDRAELSSGSNLGSELASAPGRITAAPAPDEPAVTPLEPPFTHKPLPFVLGALSPVISSRTMLMHHGAHYIQCVEAANRLVRGYKELAGKNALEIVRWANVHARGTELARTTAEVWNHWLFWQSLTPSSKRPNGELGKALARTFGDYNTFAEQFASAGTAHVGSGWLWLVASRGKQVKILTTSGTQCPEARGRTVLLAIDLWEHAYYLDHQNRRREYLDALIARRLDWDFAENRYRLFVEAHAPRRVARQRPDRNRRKHRKPARKAAARRRR